VNWYNKLILHPLYFDLLYFLYFIYIIIATFCYYCLTSEICYCDDGLNSNYTYANYDTNYWIDNYNNKTNTLHPHCTQHNGGTVYQSYAQGLQQTSEGYRYELIGDYPTNNEIPASLQPGDRSGYAQYIGVDMQGNPIYNYNYNYDYSVRDNSVQIGLIEPSRNEVINNEYYYGCGTLDTSKTTCGRRIYNKVKTGLKNHIAKSSDEAIRQSRTQTENFMADIRRAKNMDRARRTQRYIDRVNSIPVKVRKFD